MHRITGARNWLLALLLSSTLSEAATGPETAQLLNRRYQNTVAECVGANPAYFCSGVLVRVSGDSGEFWKHDPIATQLGAENFAYLRADLGTRILAAPKGMIFSDSFTAIGQGKSIDVLCSYPFGFLLNGNRLDFGCAIGLPIRKTQDVSSCATLGVTDAAGWLIHFQQQDQNPQHQCSLSSLVPSQFTASLVVHQGIDERRSTHPMQLQVRNWDSDAPSQIPIQALFYDVTKTGSMLGAQKDQRDYFNATGNWLPVLRMDLTQAPDAVFGFAQQDQLYIGYQVAARLNDRYTNTSPTCQNGKTAYHCNGVLLRGTQASRAFHMWNPSPGSVANNGVSFTYLRVDAALTKPVFKQGFIVRESAAPAATPLTVICAYPFDGATAFPVEDTCRIRGEMCNELGVTSVQAWASRYAANPGSSCAFNIDPEQFQLNIDVRPSVPHGDGWNEVMVRTWPQNIPLQIPLEAFYYSLNAYFDSDGLPQAQFGQRDYFETTGRFLPIVKLDLEAADGRVFSYNPQEQIAPGAPAAILIVPGRDL